MGYARPFPLSTALGKPLGGIYAQPSDRVLNNIINAPCTDCADNCDLIASVETITGESSIGANDGAISLIVDGGSGNYSYLWSNGQTTQNISGISCGIYSVTITDDDIDDCSITINDIEVIGLLGELQLVNISGGPCDVNIDLTLDVNGNYETALDPIPPGMPTSLPQSRKEYTLTVTRPDESTKFTVVFGVTGDNTDQSVTTLLTDAELYVGAPAYLVDECEIE